MKNVIGLVSRVMREKHYLLLKYALKKEKYTCEQILELDVHLFEDRESSCQILELDVHLFEDGESSCVDVIKLTR
jgi:hypothetical protein